jgi:hypothetical protein
VGRRKLNELGERTEERVTLQHKTHVLSSKIATIVLINSYRILFSFFTKREEDTFLYLLYLMFGCEECLNNLRIKCSWFLTPLLLTDVIHSANTAARSLHPESHRQHSLRQKGRWAVTRLTVMTSLHVVIELY